MRNKYGGACYQCGEYVAPGDGHFQKHERGWHVHHASCAIKFRGEMFTLVAKIVKRLACAEGVNNPEDLQSERYTALTKAAKIEAERKLFHAPRR